MGRRNRCRNKTLSSSKTIEKDNLSIEKKTPREEDNVKTKEKKEIGFQFNRRGGNDHLKYSTVANNTITSSGNKWPIDRP